MGGGGRTNNASPTEYEKNHHHLLSLKISLVELMEIAKENWKITSVTSSVRLFKRQV